ncbi:MAG: YidC/Oxa1 family membrane protein insertase, partial [Lachnospiraceae bacterium]|nr:YidC/Oxa1 family membrane protein insertase [Lachnospiraceae bacterium]
MNFILLTQTGGILGPFASILGLIFELIYKFFSLFGIESLALCIFAFTVVVRLLLFPMQLKQQKFSKINSVISPEIKKIQKKYENKKDQESQIAMNQEISAIYKKYGVSPAGSCLQLLIQMPILFSLYRVIYNIPAYVGQVKNYYITIISKLSASQVNEYFKIEGMSGQDILKDPEKTNKVIDIMSNFRSKETTDFVDFKLGDMINAINIPDANEAYDKIVHINKFFIYNLKETPKDMWATIGWAAIIIPVLAGLFQYLTVFLSSKMNPVDTSDMEDNPMVSSLKTMNVVMPIISVFFTWTFASGIGLYWVAG